MRDRNGGLSPMRHLNAVLTQELERARRFGRPLAVLMIDVDHLRAVNTAHGHLAGDRVLKDVAEALGRATREYDIAARFGGDEFCVLLPETALEGALVVADRIRALVERIAGEPRVRVSIGVATQQGGGTTSEELLALADRAAYRAKFSGRNSVAVPPDGDPVREAERVLLDTLDAWLLSTRGARDEVSEISPRDPARVPAHEAVRGDETGYALEECLVLVPEGGRPVRVDVDLPDDTAFVGDRHDDLAAGRREAGEISVVRVHVVDELGAAACRRRAANAPPDRNAYVLGRRRAFPGPQDEVVTLHEVDAYPRVVIEAIVEQVDGLSQHLVGFGLLTEDAVNGFERAAVVAHEGTASSRSAPSKSAMIRL
jgi:diguanylate cyclase (GGDEF)-like protein